MPINPEKKAQCNKNVELSLLWKTLFSKREHGKIGKVNEFDPFVNLSLLLI